METFDFNEIWILDTTCSFHITSRNDCFSELKEYDAGTVIMENDTISEVKGFETIRIKTTKGGILVCN